MKKISRSLESPKRQTVLREYEREPGQQRPNVANGCGGGGGSNGHVVNGGGCGRSSGLKGSPKAEFQSSEGDEVQGSRTGLDPKMQLISTGSVK